MITEWGRRNLKVILEPIAGMFRALHITPNVITLLGFLLNLVVAYLIIIDKIPWAGVVFLIAAGADAIDGTLARQLGVRNKFGAFWDSTLDRLSEAFVIMAMGYVFAMQGEPLYVMAAFLALIASFLVSYTRARGEGLGVNVKVGVGTRVERFIVTAIALLFNQILIGLVVIIALAGVTVLQRMWAVYKITHAMAAQEAAE
ncbi:MAG TPA: CDP-alcohol phosphatidyltransferase family protein [Anaerolineae bacterium]|nr:CDP-alcohol phosphatidyltransferase family protein [Caldilineae bacterium]HID33937.1 CDP-alcohol phosphatidyltransferase family protein [Anaerolineae bacterium]HIQ12596.1 CDP-alcohol phosphatidyltransferase family protein [Caldilineales bacterium]